jgi:hypothetical protein
MSDLVKQLDRIGNDILKHLRATGKPMTQTELYDISDLRMRIAYNAWSYALERLEKHHMIFMCDEVAYNLECMYVVDFERSAYLHTIQSFTNIKVKPD